MTKVALITGVTGQDGAYLVHALATALLDEPVKERIEMGCPVPDCGPAETVCTIS